uniref:ATP synthase subunit 8 n=1 Tax=Haemaphysalis yeni TaxID=1325873 RepID=A0A977XVJ3_9ACAR|nr:ATP synthase subunit 8 [Haemaphysalis yeni]
MPQIFPMNWLLITSIIMTLIIMIMTMTFFLKNSKKISSFQIKKINNHSFKW